MTISTSNPVIGLSSFERERAVLIVCLAASLCLGAFAALGSAQWLATSIGVVVIFAAAVTVPLPWVTVALAALMPFQLYFGIPGTTLTLRTAGLFAISAALRLLVNRYNRREWKRWPFWMLPAAIFLVAALIGGLNAANRYLAFKGIYDWLTIFAAAFVASETVRTRQQLARLVLVLIAGGLVQTALGLVQYASGLDAILNVLRMPISTLFFQPNLLQERLADLSFNWVVFDRASPFGTFINGIDYALFLAVVMSLVLALLFAECRRTRLALFFGCLLLMGGTLLLTFKGSGLFALGGAVATALLLSLRRPSPRMLAVGLIGLVCVMLIALPFTDLLVQRALFLLLREQGATGTAGRLEIWAGLVQIFVQRPIFGFGLNHAALLTEASRTLNGGAIAYNSPSAESAYVSTLVETGIVGLAALLALFVAAFTRVMKRARTDTLFVGIAAALVALWVGNLTVAGFTTDQNGMLLGLLIGTVYASALPESLE